MKILSIYLLTDIHTNITFITPTCNKNIDTHIKFRLSYFRQVANMPTSYHTYDLFWNLVLRILCETWFLHLKL